jgi:hypothetical protein
MVVFMPWELTPISKAHILGAWERQLAQDIGLIGGLVA